MNRLGASKSPYLKQHAHNPVDWHPWDDTALALARTTDTPIFLSVGYSACHWCHVMERESFESESIAALLRANFIAIKVDREERPDLDELYMTAVQLMTGSGGWPMSVFLTPDGRPFWGGTYFPEVRFGAIVSQLGQAWRERREEVEQVAGELSEELKKAVRRRPLPLAGGLPPAETLLAGAVEELQGRFDAAHGGFGGAPKFPPHHALRLLCRAIERGVRGEAAREMLTCTLEKMACGGIYDHIGGGFHRYSTDAIWLVPHFEKMLYDQALLIRAYAEAGALLENRGFLRVARETCEWVLRDMTDPSGGFYAALDADSEGEEGKFYVWERAEAEEVAGAEFCRRWQVREGGNWHDEATRRPLKTSIPHLAEPLPDAFDGQTLAAREALRTVRDARPWPLRDEKVLTAWNGLMVGALAFAGNMLGEPRYLDAAKKAATLCLTALRPDGRLLHRWADGEAAIPAFLDDFAYLADGLLDLADATGETHWRKEARSLMDELLTRFWDGEETGFFFTSAGHEALLTRSKDLFDGALPGPNGVAARVLARLDDPHAEKLLTAYAGLLVRAPQGTATLIEAVALCRPALHLVGRGREAGPGESAELTFSLSIPEGWHADEINATLTSDAPAAVGPVQEEGMEFRVPVQVAPDAAPGIYRVTLTLSLVLCTTDRCLPPTELRAEATVAVQAS